MFTCNDEIGSDVSEVFMQLTGLGKSIKLKHLWQSPFTLHSRTIKAIQNEQKIASGGGKARIIAKMNALLEPEIIAAIYKASQAGVRVDLIVRGVCALRPGIKGVSDNVRVISVLGRFLEHSRVFYFYNAGAEDVYLSSADWMDRNFFRRIEVCFPVLDARLKKRVIREGLKPFLARDIDAWEMDSSGRYKFRKGRRGSNGHVQTRLLGALAETS
jgi:polyphosphate kinase